MRYKVPFYRNTVSIVQQTNTVTTRDVIRNYSSGRSLDISLSSALPPSFDFDDQNKIDWDKEQLSEADNLLNQSSRRDEFVSHFNPTPPDNSQDESNPGTEEA